MSICWIDIIILLPILAGLIIGICRGLVAELAAVLAVILGVFSTRLWGAEWAIWFNHTMGWNMPACTVVAYSILFLGVTILCILLGKAFQKMLKAIKLNWVNRLLGAICGTAKWTIIVLVLVFIVGQIDTQFSFIPSKIKQQSALYQPALNTANKVWIQVKNN